MSLFGPIYEGTAAVQTWQWNWPWPPQGWQCPCCRRCYSPTTPMCSFCPEPSITTTTTGTGSGSGT